MLNYEEFKEKIKDEITDHMSSEYKDCKVDIRETKKTNRTVEGLMLREIPGLSNASPTIYVNDLFEEYEKNGDFETVIDRAGKTMEIAIKSFDKNMADDAINTSKMMDNVFFTLINAEQNRELLETIPHREFEDLAIVYRWNLGAGSDGVYTNLINNELAEKERPGIAVMLGDRGSVLVFGEITAGGRRAGLCHIGRYADHVVLEG